MAERIESLNTLKGLALFFVVYIHARGFFIGKSSQAEILGFLTHSTARFAVPVFFLISGYLFHIKINEKDSGKSYTEKYLKGIGKYYVIGSLIYFSIQSGVILFNQWAGLGLIQKVVSLNLLGVAGLLDFLYFGKAVSNHLWFLPALFFSVLIVYAFHRKERLRELLILSAGLHLFGILANAYKVIDLMPVPKNDALFFGLFLTTVGFHIGKIDRERGLKDRDSFLFLSAAFVTGLIHLGERILITAEVETLQPYFYGDYSLFTGFFAISIFLYALSKPDLGKNTVFNRYGEHTLWGYILHIMTIGLFVGLTILLESYTALNILGSFLWSITVAILSYFTTMELICRAKGKKLRNTGP